MIRQTEIDIFLKMVDSLRRHQRAELIDEKYENIIEKLYTDPIEGDFVLKSMSMPQTTALIGRKGTGKSTIIGRFQHEIRKTEDKLSLYIDVKTIFDQSQGTPNFGSIQNILSHDEYQKYILYKTFIKAVIDEIKQEINKNIFTSRFLKMFSNKGITEKDFRGELENIFKEVDTPKFEDITALKSILKKEIDEYKETNNDKSIETAKLDPSLELGKEGLKVRVAEFGFESERETKEEQVLINNEEYSTLFIRYFNIITFINKIKELLKKAGINLVFICLDDASELEKSSLDIFMRTLIAPLNNSADGFFKFKISFYPGRDYLPNIDRTKIEIINIDYYNLYQSHGVDKVEENAIIYTKRLLETRFKYFFGEDINIDNFFDTKINSIEDYYKQIFQASANVPRIIGKLLWYAAKRSISRGDKITKRVLQEASKEHYIQEIEPILNRNEYIQYKYFDEKFEKEHLKKLLDLIVLKAKENKRQIGNSLAEIFKEYDTNTAPSNYLYFPPLLEDILKTLELNFFISKYAQQKDKGSGNSKNNYVPPKEVSIYTINYGLCQKENIIVDEGSNRKFRTERVFDYTNTIIEWISSTQRVKCSSCGTIHPIEKWEAIKMLDNICPKCHQKTCLLEGVEVELPILIDESLKISEKDYQVLNVLKIESDLTSPQIAMEVNRSYQSINQSVRDDRFLIQNNLIDKRSENGKNKYRITDKALEIYFK